MNEKRLVQVLLYDSKWPVLYESEAKCIKEKLADNCIQIYHIGSTAVPGLAAKPVIDIIVVVSDMQQMTEAQPALKELGYESKGEYGIPFRHYFQKGGNNRSHQIHMFEINNAETKRHVLFRDWLRAHSKDKEAYAVLKKQLAVKFPYDIDSYCLGKEDFITKIDRKTGFSGLRMVIACTPREWEAVNYFCHLLDADDGVANSDLIDNLTNYQLILYHGVDIVGYMHLVCISDSQCVMRQVMIKKSFRHQGNGKHFVKLCERWLNLQHYTSLQVESTFNSKDFFISLGYLEMNSPYNKRHVSSKKIIFQKDITGFTA